MNYKEVSDLLVKIGDEAGLKVFQTDASSGLTVTALYVIPLQWFVAVELNHRLNFGVYHGPDLRLVGTKQIRFDQLTPDHLRSLVARAIAMRALGPGVGEL